MSFSSGGGSIASSSDVALSNPADSQVLTYNATLGKWDNEAAQSAVSANLQSADYTLALSDAGQVVELNSSSAITLTVPNNTSVAFPVGTVIEIAQVGSGMVTIAAASGVTLNTPASLASRTQFSSLGLRKRFANTWIVSGDLA